MNNSFIDSNHNKCSNCSPSALIHPLIYNALIKLDMGEKSVVYQNRSRTLDDIKDAITTECQRIRTLNRVNDSFIKKIKAFVNVEGEVNNLSICYD